MLNILPTIYLRMYMHTKRFLAMQEKNKNTNWDEIDVEFNIKKSIMCTSLRIKPRESQTNVF